MLAPTVCGGGTQPCPASQPIGRVLVTTLMPGKVVTCGSKTAQAAVLTPESLRRRVMPATHPPEAVLSQSTSGSCGAPRKAATPFRWIGLGRLHSPKMLLTRTLGAVPTRLGGETPSVNGGACPF